MDHCSKCGADVIDFGIFACGQCTSCATEDHCRGCTGDLDCPARSDLQHVDDFVVELYNGDDALVVLPNTRAALDPLIKRAVVVDIGRPLDDELKRKIRRRLAQLFRVLDDVIAQAVADFAEHWEPEGSSEP